MSGFEVMGEHLEHLEGPVACDDGSVIVGEVRTGRVVRVRPDGSHHCIAQTKGGPNGLAVGPDGALYACNNGGFEWRDGETFPVGPAEDYESGSIDRIDVSTGRVERLYDQCDGIKLAGPNDIIFDRWGNLWFTDLGKNLGDVELPGGLYYAKADGSSIRRIAYGVGLNGVGLSPDGETVYAAASYTRWVLAYKAGLNPPEQGRGPIAGGAEIVFDYPRRRLLDSMAIEADGTIALGVCIEETGISRIDLVAKTETTLPFPDIVTSNIAFGGRDMQTAYVTLTTTNRLVKLRWPAPGLRLPFNL